MISRQNLLYPLMGIMGIVGVWLSAQGVYLNVKAQLAQYLLERAWQQSIEAKHPQPPWPWADTWPIAKIEFVKQRQSYIIMQGSSGRTLAFAPGHLTGSALPGGLGHSIISAHRDTHFAILEAVNIDDILIIYTRDNQSYSYQIQSIRIIDSRSEPLRLEPERRLLTLITCYPFDSINAGSPFRYRVDAVPLFSI